MGGVGRHTARETARDGARDSARNRARSPTHARTGPGSAGAATLLALDGRRARAARTRTAVVEALLQLLDAGELRPGALRIAERAGVSLRTVFEHFDDLESLFAAAAERQIERVRELAGPLPAAGPREARLRGFVARRARLLEQISPVRRAALLHAPFSPEIQRRLRWVAGLLRREVERTFAPELQRCRGKARGELLHALDVAADWPTWEALRAGRRLSPARARGVVERLLRAILENPS